MAGVCRLPIADISEARGWFITYPGGQRADDPASVVALPGGTPGALGQNPGLAYVWPQRTWVPVRFDAVRPDGAVYAYSDLGSRRLMSMTVPGGVAASLATDGPWYPLGVASEGVYARRAGDPAIYRVGWSGGPPVAVASGAAWARYAAGALWGIDGGVIVRHDLVGGTETRWGSVSVFGLAGFDRAGTPLAITAPDGLPAGSIALSSVPARGAATQLWTAVGGIGVSQALGDASGIWWEAGGGLVGGPGHGLYHWTPGSGAQLISTPEANLAGPCS